MNGLQWFKELMISNYDCRVDCVGVGKQDDTERRVLGRVISIGELGVTYELGQRHVEAVCHELGLYDGNSCAALWRKRAAKKAKQHEAE